MQVQPYLTFGGRCEEAMTFYGAVLGASVTFMMRQKEAPAGGPPVPPGWEEKIMHANLQVGSSQIMASDGMPGQPVSFAGFSLSLDPASVEEAQRLCAALADGGTVLMPVQKTFWAEGFGMVRDRFGVSWMLNVVP
ncbi:VOC family protein [Cupriavidus sp. USMAA2-4]|uniref:VOC family protein n=1 Tax=Cupriavidus malaysiensis TaxID=367825 RepID=A0ABM6FCQ2_9BURK|nr:MULTISPECIES: VOC family protein [Cupriavidus]AOY96479.1 VOC family protein [Cupriavidus sp. USMAA2-4]AOZ09517.1 VOC family protein [Cupriavidus malaysiensis]